MEEVLARMLPGLGSGGVVAAVLYWVAKRYFEDAKAERALLEIARKDAMNQQSARIAVLENSLQVCQADRTALWERLLDKKLDEAKLNRDLGEIPK
jgi:hypothetical protein